MYRATALDRALYGVVGQVGKQPHETVDALGGEDDVGAAGGCTADGG